MKGSRREYYISVDVEADGPIPGEYSLSSIGACLAGSFQADDPELRTYPIVRPDPVPYPIATSETTFYVELQPISDRIDAEAAAIAGLDRGRLTAQGAPAGAAMTAFRDWLRSTAGDEGRPVFVSFGTFDWMYIAWYFHKFVGENPFGPNGMDLKSYYMAKERTIWAWTSKSNLKKKYQAGVRHTHHALDDSIEQALIFQRLWAPD